MALVVPVALGVEGVPTSPAPLPSTHGAAPVPSPAAIPLLEALAFAPSDAASVEWSCWWTNAGASCDVTHGAVEVRASIKYPRWRPRSDADPAVVARWDAFMGNLRTHELGHVTIALQGADAIDDLLDAGLSASTCGRLERLANRAASHLYDQFAKLDRVYDQQTDHGISQGTGLP